MRIVLDTNVLVAGLLTPFGPCGEIVRMVSSGELALAIDARLLTEYAEVLRRSKFKFEKDKIDVLLDYIEFRGLKTAPSPLTRSLPDADDGPFLEVAIAARAACIITGNKNHFPADLCRGANVLSPRDFLKFYIKHRKAVR